MKSNKLKCWLAAVVVAVICCPAALAQQSKIAVASGNRHHGTRNRPKERPER